MFHFFKRHIPLLAVLIIAGILRFYMLSDNPPGLYVDEAATGYNAFSILNTGKDEYGKSFPLFFRSFGDYKMPLNIYLTVLPVWLLGLNIFSVRIISVMSGAATTIIIYLLTREIFKKNDLLPLLTAFVYAVCPWSVFISRVAFEGNIALFLLLSGLLLQLKALSGKNNNLMLLSIFVYAFSAYSYHTERFIAPVIMPFVLVLNYREKVVKAVRPFLLLMLLLSPHIILFFSSAGQARITALAVENNSVRNFFSLYTSYFSPRNLFFAPDPDLQRSYPELSVFYPWMVIPFFIGLYLFFSKKLAVGKPVLLFFLLVAPLPVALSRDPFSTYRSYPMVFPYAVIIGLGMEKIASVFRNRKLKIVIFLSLFVFSMGSLYRSGFVLLPKERFTNWSFGYSQIAKALEEKSYDKVLVNDEVGVSYIELLFFLHYPASAFQKEQSRINLADYYNIKEWSRTVSWGKFSIRPIIWREDIYTPQLIIAKPVDLSEGQAKEHFLVKSFVIMGLDGKPLFNGYLTNPEKKIEDDKRKLKLISK